MPADSGQLVRLDASFPARESPKPLFGLDAESLAALLAELGEPAFRGRQLAEAIYRQHITEIDAISTLPAALRRRLSGEGWQVGRPRIAQIFQSVDGTERYLVECQNRNQQPAVETVETVWMPEGDNGESGDESEAETAEAGWTRSGFPGLGKQAPEPTTQPGATSFRRPPDESVGDQAKTLRAPSFRLLSGERAGNHDPNPAVLQPSNTVRQAKSWSRATICVSSQIGCAVNCQFCLTAKLGLQRNLTAGEIAGQVVAVMARHGVEVGRDRLNLVFMGMGEPFLNYASFMAAVRLLIEEVGLSPRRMTVSTSGIVPGIESFAQEPPELRPKLAISLNAPNDQVRAEIMPINRKWPIESVLDAVRKVTLRPRERITFEYVLLSGVTDRPEHAREVARLVRRANLPAKVNLIAWNPGPGIPYAMPSPEAIENFRTALAAEGIPVYLRQPRGRDIYAACGQLKRTVEEAG
jgi:23S rRNA (adenine2503-C2)-methyltransferase